MKRLVVLIGVRKPGGGLQELESIEKCLKDMRAWALSQDIPPGDIKTFTDIPALRDAGDRALLSVNDIYDWIDSRAKEDQPADQLLIYFSGHGMQSGGATLWLLPQAPAKDWEAINLDSSKELAVWSRFKHIVFIADCCATVAGNAQFDLVKGASILENTPDERRIKAQPVDFLRAARPGKVSLEVVVDGVSLSPYTVQLVEALSGTPPTILEPQTQGATAPLLLRVRKLADELQISVNSFLRRNKIQPPGPPYDKIVSTTQWIARFPALPLLPQPPVRVPSPPGQAPPPKQAPVPSGSFEFVLSPAASARTVAPLMGYQSAQPASDLKLDLNDGLRQIAGGSLAAVAGFEWSSHIPDGYHYETQCGFFITGTEVRSAEVRPGVECEVLSGGEIRLNPGAMELVSIEFKGGGGIMIPAIPREIGFIHVENGRFTSVAYEPSGHVDFLSRSILRKEFETKSQRIRNLRDTLLNVVTGGDLTFTDIDPNTMLAVINDIHYGDKLDFSTLLYLAYAAYASTYAKPAILILAGYMQNQFGFVPFDLQILLSLARLKPRRYLQIAPPFPLLTQGWSLLEATHESLPEELTELREHYRNTPWTHLDSYGVDLCRAYLARQTTSGTSGQSGDIPITTAEPAVELDLDAGALWVEQMPEFLAPNAMWEDARSDAEEQERRRLMNNDFEIS